MYPLRIFPSNSLFSPVYLRQVLNEIINIQSARIGIPPFVYLLQGHDDIQNNSRTIPNKRVSDFPDTIPPELILQSPCSEAENLQHKKQ